MERRPVAGSQKTSSTCFPAGSMVMMRSFDIIVRSVSLINKSRKTYTLLHNFFWAFGDPNILSMQLAHELLQYSFDYFRNNESRLLRKLRSKIFCHAIPQTSKPWENIAVSNKE